MQYLLLFFFFLFYPLLLLLLGLIFFKSPLLFIIAMAALLSILLFSDKALLIFFPISRKNIPWWAENFIKNLAFAYKIKNLHVLTTTGKNIYSLEGIFFSRRILIGEDFFTFFSKDECQALIFASFWRIIKRECYFRQITFLLIEIFFFPFRKLPWQGLRITFLSSRYLVRNYFFRQKKKISTFDRELGPYRRAFASALFKLNVLNEEMNPLEELGFTDNKSDSVLEYFFTGDNDFHSRYNQLMRDNGKS